MKTNANATCNIDTKTVLGSLTLNFLNGELTALSFTKLASTQNKSSNSTTALIWNQQILEYLARSRYHFDLPIHLSGTPFQLSVWQRLQEIPYGQTTSYAAIARAIGRPQAWRAVGTAVGKNPIPIVIPCHRVLPTSGEIGYYSAGRERKHFLLKIEGFANK